MVISDHPGHGRGLFYRDTRYLSHYELRIEGKRPLLLSSVMHENKAALSVDLTNPDVAFGEHDKLPRDTIFVERTKFLRKGSATSASASRITTACAGACGSTSLQRRLPDLSSSERAAAPAGNRPSHRPSSRLLQQLDGIERRTVLTSAPRRSGDSKRATFVVEGGPGEQTSVFVNVCCGKARRPTSATSFAYRDASSASRLDRRYCDRRDVQRSVR